MAEPKTGVAPVALYTQDGYEVPQIQGEGWLCSAKVAYDDAVAADSAFFSMKVATGGKSVYITQLYGDVGFNGTGSAVQQGFYLERFTGLAHTAGTAITALAQNPLNQDGSAVYDIRFRTGLLTATGVVYEGAKWGRVEIPASVTSTSREFSIQFPRGLVLPPGWGMALRSSTTTVTGTVININVEWVER